jgi:hypothetical protein
MNLFKRKIVACVAICITAILGIAVCGCDDLGAYEDVEEYYDAFDNVVFLGGAAGNGKSYPVKDYFYNDQSREDFLVDENGEYTGVVHSDYVYIAIPFNKGIQMDSLAMYIQATDNVTVYMNVYLIDKKKIPSNWKKLSDSNASNEEQKYDDPDPKTRIGEITVDLKAGKWNSFVLDYFKDGENNEKSITVASGQYILLQIRNNSGVRELNTENGLRLDRAEITMTNLLVRALEIENNTKAEEGEE